MLSYILHPKTLYWMVKASVLNVNITCLAKVLYTIKVFVDSQNGVLFLAIMSCNVVTMVSKEWELGSHRKVGRWGWNNWTKRDQRSLASVRFWGGQRAWNLRAPELTVICMLSTLRSVQGLSLSVLFTLAHSYLFCSNSSPRTGCKLSHDFLFVVP